MLHSRRSSTSDGLPGTHSAYKKIHLLMPGTLEFVLRYECSTTWAALPGTLPTRQHLLMHTTLKLVLRCDCSPSSTALPGTEPTFQLLSLNPFRRVIVRSNSLASHRWKAVQMVVCKIAPVKTPAESLDLLLAEPYTANFMVQVSAEQESC